MGGNKRSHFLKRPQHEHNEKDDFRTPMYLINYLKRHFGEGLRDGACSPENMKGEPFNVFSDDSMLKGEWLYINPPYDTPSIIRFVRAAVLHSEKGHDVVFLIPNKLCQKEWCLHINQHFDEIMCLGGRVNFESPYAVKGGSSMNGCFFGIIYGDLSKKNEHPRMSFKTLKSIKGMVE